MKKIHIILIALILGITACNSGNNEKSKDSKDSLASSKVNPEQKQNNESICECEKLLFKTTSGDQSAPVQVQFGPEFSSFEGWVDENSKLYTGKCKTNYDNGKLKLQAEFKNGRLIGEVKQFYKNENVKSIFIIEDGVKVSAQSWDENKSLTDDFVNGKYEKVYENGILIKNQIFDKNNKAIAGSKFFGKDGTLKNEFADKNITIDNISYHILNIYWDKGNIQKVYIENGGYLSSDDAHNVKTSDLTTFLNAYYLKKKSASSGSSY